MPLSDWLHLFGLLFLELCGYKHSLAQVRFSPFLKMNGLFILGKSVTFLMNIHHTNYRPLKRFGAIFKKK